MVELDPNFAFTSALRTPVPTSTVAATSITSKLANIFKKSIKRDLVLFAVSKEDN